MYIGETLSDKEVALLQTIAYNCGGALYGQVDELVNTMNNHYRDCKCALELNDLEFARALKVLKDEGLIQFMTKNNIRYVGLTEDGSRCNRIIVW